MKTYRIDVPKAGSSNEMGTEVRLYQHGETVEAAEQWQDDLMQMFVGNGWATETKMDAPPPKRARNDDGTLKGDDPATPEVNEAWEGGEAPQKAKAPRKASKRKATAKK